MSTISITEELFTLKPSSPDYARERMRLMVEYLQAYMSTYDQQYNYQGYTDKTFIDDVLYGLGVAIDPRAHQFANGFDRWKKHLKAEYL